MKVSSPDEETIRTIAEACLKDDRLFEVVKALACFSEEEKRAFASKMKLYFFDKSDPESMEALKFFTILLENENAQLVLEKIRGEHT
ncbi:MAG: hypothetical protein PWP37_11 [Thermotogota bacterium]|nr:hypothetical protein [Thermotogota bacterium]MDK2863819.1 hypothetical protein [Thermotogota bacterium]HCZ05758.1 hypothetical protein [Thermotogota bacterium]